MSKWFEQLLCELWAEPTEHIVAYRNMDRWVQQYVPAPLRAVGQIPAFRHGGVYLITGGLGGLGLAFAEHISRAFKAKSDSGQSFGIARTERMASMAPVARGVGPDQREDPTGSRSARRRARRSGLRPPTSLTTTACAQ